jgi:hypothetical protein
MIHRKPKGFQESFTDLVLDSALSFPFVIVIFIFTNFLDLTRLEYLQPVACTIPFRSPFSLSLSLSLFAFPFALPIRFRFRSPFPLSLFPSQWLPVVMVISDSQFPSFLLLANQCF